MTDYTRCSSQDLTEKSVEIVSAYVSNNSVPLSELPKLIRDTHAAFVALASGGANTVGGANEAGVEKPTPAEIRKSIRGDGIVSFIDGKSYKTLKRHLTSHGLDPSGYRERYGLPSDYPMTAPSYAAQRAAIAKATGLGVPGARGVQLRTGTDD